MKCDVGEGQSLEKACPSVQVARSAGSMVDSSRSCTLLYLSIIRCNLHTWTCFFGDTLGKRSPRFYPTLDLSHVASHKKIFLPPSVVSLPVRLICGCTRTVYLHAISPQAPQGRAWRCFECRAAPASRNLHGRSQTRCEECADGVCNLLKDHV